MTKIMIPKQKIDLWPHRPCWHIWCPVVFLVGGSGVLAVSRKTPIYNIDIAHKVDDVDDVNDDDGVDDLCIMLICTAHVY